MSKVVDDRVVEMRFDNRDFETNVQKSMSTLERLKQALKLPGASKSLENVSSAAKNVDFSGMSSGIDTVNAKFSNLQVIGMTALSNITTAAMQAGQSMASALTIGPIVDGFREYETQIGSVQTILSNTKHKGTTIDQVNAALDELNHYADQTIYNFGEMTRNIGTFTAAGVDLDKSVTAIKGIANLAAMSGSSSLQASTAMYQLSQALAAGRVSLMDWNSVVNAGMGGQVFQDALKQTAEHFGYDVDGMIEKYGSFRESLTQGGWLTAEVLTETLTQLSGAYTEADLIAQGYTEEQARQIVELSKTALGAATEVKTFTGLIDTAKEAMGSGWAQSFEIIVGDFEEAKELFTDISNTLGDVINSSAEARNKVLQGWKDLGGRDDLVASLKNVFEGIGSIVKPISEAFKEIFPPVTAEGLKNFTEGLEQLTQKLILSDEASAALKSTFKGIFSVVDILGQAFGVVVDVVGSVLGVIWELGGAALGVTGGFGEFVSGIRDAISESKIFESVANALTSVIDKIADGIRDFGSKIRESLDFSGFQDFFKGFSDFVTKVGSGFGSVFSSIFSGLGDSGFFEVLNSALFSGVLYNVINFVKSLGDSFGEVSGVLENVTGILDDVRGCFEAYQNNLQAGTLLKIASAIGILALSLIAISTIDGEKLAQSLGAISVLFAELIGAMFLFSKIDIAGAFGAFKAITTMIGLSASILILAGALKVLSSIDTEGLVKGLVAVGVLMAEIAAFLQFAKLDGRVMSSATGILILSAALVVLAQAVKQFGSMDIGSLVKGLVSVGVLLGVVAGFTNIAGKSSGILSTGASLVLIAGSMKILASAVKDFGNMNLGQIGSGLLAMGGALLAVAGAMRVMPPNLVASGAGLVIVAGAMKILAEAMASFGGMSWGSIGTALVAMGGALAELAIALNLMNGTLAGSAALIIAAGALSLLAPVLVTLGNLSWEQVATGLVALAGAFTVIGVAGMLLTPLVPTLLGLAGAIALFGVSVLAIGAGVALVGVGLTSIATGIGALAVALSAGATSIVAGLSVIITGIAELIPTIMRTIGEGIVAFAQVLGEYAPQLADSFLKLITEVLNSLATYTPQMVDAIATLIIGVINSLAAHVPDFISAIMNLVGAIFQGVIDAIGSLDTSTLVNGLLTVGLIAAFVAAMSALAPMVPGAMVGLLGVGALVAELSLILAALGALNQIPGLDWLIGEGGNLLQSVGTAIGQFVGGIIGGVAQGATGTLPEVANSLSEFMTNLQPFIDGASNLNSSSFEGVSALTGAILQLTGANLLDKIASFIGGGSTLGDFAEQLKPFGEGMREYADAVSGIDPETVTASATAAQAIAQLAANIPNSGGLAGLFAGENDLGEFAEQLEPFGEGMKKYSDAVAGINPETVTASATAAQSLAELAKSLPNSGGAAGFFAGENDLGTFANQLEPFGQGMKKYSEAVSGIDPATVTASATAGQSLVELAKSLPNSGGVAQYFTGGQDLSTFAEQLEPFGQGMKKYSEAISGINPEAVTASASAGQALAQLASSLPNSGGVFSFFTGEQDLSSFGTQITSFGTAMKSYSDSINGINPEAITASATAGQALAQLASSLPNTGGVFSFFTGEQDLAGFSTQIVAFGNAMRLYSFAVTGINPEAIIASVTAGQMLVNLANTLPNTGGVFSFFTGEQDLGAFASQITAFGFAMRSYSFAVSGINPEAIMASATAGQMLVNLANTLPNTGGVFSFFSGEKDLSSFASQITSFGYAMRSYSIAVSGINPEAVVASATAGQALVNLGSSLTNSGGVLEFFTGDKDLAGFAEQLVPFGYAMRAYSFAVAGIDTGSVIASVSAARALIDVANSLSNSGGVLEFFAGGKDLSGFANQLVPFGYAMRSYSYAVAGIDTGSIIASVSAARSIVTLINSTAGLDTSGVSSFVSAINTLGTANVAAFVAAFQAAAAQMTGVGMNIMANLANGIMAGQGLVNAAMTTVIAMIITQTNAKAPAFTNAGRLLMTSLSNGVQASAGLLRSAFTTALSSAAAAVRGYYSSFYSAGSYISSGLAAGMRSQLASVRSAAAEIANLAAQAARDAAKVRSPSRVFYEIGSYLGMGLVNALNDYQRISYKAGYGVADSASSGLSKAISKVGDLLESDIDMNPKISPVLDLSNIENGVGNLSNLLNTTGVVDMIGNAGVINGRMNQRIQNGTSFSDVVGAIDKLRRDVSEISQPSYIVEGITYDSGTAVSTAIEDLVRATRIERRV